MNPGKLFAMPDGAVRAVVVLLIFTWHLPIIAAEGCDSLDSLRENAQSSFSKIIGNKLEEDGKYLSSLTLPNANQCVIQIYSATESKYSCEWVVAKERASEESVRIIFENVLVDVARCALSNNEVVRKKLKGRSGETAFFPDGRYPEKSVEAFIALEYGYFSPWWLMELEYHVGGER